MLRRLAVKNFALIDDLAIEFTPGLNVITGETGAGKSLIIDALQVALGRRAGGETVRTGSEKAVLEAVFDIGSAAAIASFLHEEDIDLEDGYLILWREIGVGGRSLYRLNGRTVPLSIYRNIGHMLVDFHGQGEQQSLLQESTHRELLDRFGGESLLAVRNEVNRLYEMWQQARQELEELRNSERDRWRLLDSLNYHIEEIDRAQVQPGEDEELEKERLFLRHAEKIARLATEAYALLYESETGQPTATDLIGQAAGVLRELAPFDQELQEQAAALEGILGHLQEIAGKCGHLRERAAFEPGRLDMVEERLALLRRLKQKYGETLAEVLRYREEAAAEKERLSRATDRTSELERQVQEVEGAWQAASRVLSEERKKAARRLQQEVARELVGLEMGRVNFQAELVPRAGPAPAGAEEVTFLFSPNPGEPPKPLAKIASGGELSRVMLALKTILARVDDVPCLIFDEVDAGIGGRALQAVAERLWKIGQDHQVICVTHAAQIACYAAQHHHIYKEVTGGRTRTGVRVLTGEERIEELARMLAGKEITPVARQHAEELVRRAQRVVTTC
ncbi:MAG: DNA repair protein RecN [Desulfotomaculales bacterium]